MEPGAVAAAEHSLGRGRWVGQKRAVAHDARDERRKHDEREERRRPRRAADEVDEPVGIDCFGFALPVPEALATAAEAVTTAAETVTRKMPDVRVWNEVSASASPNYGAIAIAKALAGRTDNDSEDDMTGWF